MLMESKSIRLKITYPISFWKIAPPSSNFQNGKDKVFFPDIQSPKHLSNNAKAIKEPLITPRSHVGFALARLGLF